MKTLLAISIAFLALGSAHAMETNDVKPGQVKSSPFWKLEWSDEFDKDGKPDQSKWDYITGGDGFGNGEEQFYTDRVENARVENGKMMIQGRKEEYQNQHYTSARLFSKQSWVYGRFEFRAKLPHGRGTWPAIWMLPDKQVYGPTYWPDNGEIDILESVGRDQNRNYASAHCNYYNFFAGNGQHTTTINVPSGDELFHTYALEWSPTKMEFFIDGEKFMGVDKEADADWKKWPFDQPFHFVMNMAIGGGFGRGGGDIEDEALPTALEVEYIRVYKPIFTPGIPSSLLPNR
jgi:beta-glucanase (GH16 family)